MKANAEDSMYLEGECGEQTERIVLSSLGVERGCADLRSPVYSRALPGCLWVTEELVFILALLKSSAVNITGWWLLS
jgi:hypothetical protein